MINYIQLRGNKTRKNLPCNQPSRLNSKPSLGPDLATVKIWKRPFHLSEIRKGACIWTINTNLATAILHNHSKRPIICYREQNIREKIQFSMSWQQKLKMPHFCAQHFSSSSMLLSFFSAVWSHSKNSSPLPQFVFKYIIEISLMEDPSFIYLLKRLH